MHLISIITPFYNAFNTIDETVHSVLSQSYTNWELIICNDHGEKGYDYLKNRYSDKRVKVINNDGSSGASFARNKAIEASKGRFIAFLDSDDIWLTNKLEVQLEFMLSTQCAFSYGNYYSIKNTTSDSSKHEDVGSYEAPDTIGFRQLLKHCPIGCLTVMLDRESIPNISLPDIGKEDYALWLKICKTGIVAKRYPGILAKYRLSSDSLSSNKYKEIPKQYRVLRSIAELNPISAGYNVILYSLNGLIKHFVRY